MITDAEQKKAAKRFAEVWDGQGYEKGDSQKFWLSLLQEVYGVEHPAEYIRFEDQVKIDHTSFIDGIIPKTHVLIEQKSLGKSLMTPIKQSDGSLLTPYQQAKRYSAELPYSERPRWIVTCNFGEFNIYDMEKPSGEPEVVYLKDLHKDYYRLNFLVDVEDENIKKETEVSLQAGPWSVCFTIFATAVPQSGRSQGAGAPECFASRLVFVSMQKMPGFL